MVHQCPHTGNSSIIWRANQKLTWIHQCQPCTPPLLTTERSETHSAWENKKRQQGGRITNRKCAELANVWGFSLVASVALHCAATCKAATVPAACAGRETCCPRHYHASSHRPALCSQSAARWLVPAAARVGRHGRGWPRGGCGHNECQGAWATLEPAIGTAR